MTTKHDRNFSISSIGEQDNNIEFYLPVIRTSVYSFLFTLGVFGNIVVILATGKFVYLRRATNLLICNLCVCDAFVLGIGIPLFAIGEAKVTEETLCKLTSALLEAFITASVLTLLSIAIERYFSIVHYHRKLRLTRKRAYMLILSINVISLLTSVPKGLSMTIEENKCMNQWSHLGQTIYSVLSFLLQYAIPLVSMSFLYSRSWQKIRRKNRVAIRITKDIKRSTSFNGDLYLQQQKHCTNENGFIKRTKLDQEKNENNTQKSDSDNNNMSETRMMSASSNYLTDAPSLTPVKRSNSAVSVLISSSFRGSVNRLHRSFTNIVTGAEINQEASPFVLKRSRQTIATLKLFFYILTIFAICMIPHHVVQLIHSTHVRQLERYEHYWNLLHLFLYINAALNPWIYAGLNLRYRQAFRRLLTRSNIGKMLKQNFFRSTSGRIILEKKSKRQMRMFKPCYMCVTNADQPSHENAKVDFDMEYSTDTLDGLNERTYSKASKFSRSEEIAICVPIIIITNYDEDLERDRQHHEC